jgi:hypothetical protein
MRPQGTTRSFSHRMRTSPLESLLRNAVERVLDADDASGLHHIPQLDPLTTARYLRVANSPLYGRRRRVGSPSEAIEMMGSRASAMIALVSSFDYGFSNRRHGDRLEHSRRHSLQVAVLARHLADCTGFPDISRELFIAGLLHDIAEMLRPEEPRSAAVAGHDSRSAQRSAQLLTAWHLPHSIVDTIAELGGALDGRPAASPSGRLLWVVHVHAPRITSQGDELERGIAVMASALDVDSIRVRDGFLKAQLTLAQIGGEPQ